MPWPTLEKLADQINFRTMTTNPKCPEILESLTPGQQTHDCLDPLVRVFRPKIQKLLKDGCFDCLEA